MGLLLIAAGGALAGYNIREDRLAQEASEKTMEQLEVIQRENAEQRREISKDKGPIADEVGEELDPDREMPTVLIDGYEYIGSLTIPPLEVQFPVTEEWDYERMKIAVCRYSGTVYRDDLVICAHNYNNFFRKLDKLQEGDRVIFTDVEGVSYEYKVAETEVLVPTAVEKMKTGDWDLTLFTCNYMGDARVAVRCDRIEK